MGSPGFWPGYFAVSLKVYSKPGCNTLARTTKLDWLAPVVVTNASARLSVAPLLSTQLHARRNSAVVRPGALARLTVLLRRTLLLAPYFETPSKVPTATSGTL